ncbi:MAG TPA: monovalent cation/H(+) antiporter subunit G [Thalassobaculum sp.]
MTDGIDLPAWVAILTAALVLTGATLTLVGSIGLLNLPDFYQRLHAPTLGTTLGTGTILLASITYFSVLDTRPVVHEILIGVFVTVTTPVTLILLARATRFRGLVEPPPPPPGEARDPEP